MNSNELYILGRRVEIPRGQPIALTKQINDIATLKQKGNLSTTFSVLHLRQNEANLGFVNRPGNTSKVPYRFLPAYYIQNGIQIVSNGQAVVTDSGKDETNVTLYWGNSDFFERLNFPLSELDTTEIDHVYTLSNGTTLFTDTGGKAFYPFIDLNNGNLLLGISDIVLYLERTPPAVTFKYLFEKIAEKIGFTFTGNILNTDFFNTLTLQLTSRDAAIPNLEDRFIIANFFEATPLPDFFSFTPILDNDDSFAIEKRYTNKIGVTAMFTFRIVWDSIYVAEFEQQIIPIDERVTFNVLINGEVINSQDTETFWTTPRIYDVQASMQPEDYLQLQIVVGSEFDPTRLIQGAGSTITTINIEKDGLDFGDTFLFSQNLPNITASELLLRFAQLTGVIFNSESRVVDFIQYEDIKATKTNNKPFPAKPIKNSIRTTFDPGGYAQSNIIRYAQSVIETSADAKIDNTRLARQSDFLTLNFYLPQSFFNNNHQSVRVLWFEDEQQKDIISPIYNYQIRTLSAITRMRNEVGDSQQLPSAVFPITSQITPQAIRDTFYRSLFEVLNDFKMYSANFLINESQFFELVNYEAYYIDELMCFIYPESIQNFVPGRATKINMVKI